MCALNVSRSLSLSLIVILLLNLNNCMFNVNIIVVLYSGRPSVARPTWVSCQVVVSQVYGLQSRVFGESSAPMYMHFITLMWVSVWLLMSFIFVSTAEWSLL